MKSNGWPNAEQLWLLRACLGSGTAAQEAWKTWTSRIDFDRIDHASAKLLPLLSRNPSLQGLDDPIFKKCQGAYRRVWVENRLNWDKVAPLLRTLEEAGVDKIILLKGMAMILGYYKDFGVRVIGDIDILIDRAHLPIAEAFLKRNQWKANLANFPLHDERYLQRWHALNFTHSEGMALDLHWSLIQENCPSIDGRVLRDAKRFPGDPFYLPCPTDLFFQACVHGVKHSPVPLIRWVADAVTIWKTAESEMDGERLIELAKSAHVCMPLCLALEFLVKEFSVSIPPNLIQRLQAVPSIRLEILEHRSHAAGYGAIAGWYRYCLNRGYLTTKSQLLNIHKYLQISGRLKSPWYIPFFSVYWVFKRLVRKFNQWREA